jgi:hypothetical protein
MKEYAIDREEVIDVLHYINLIKIKFEQCDLWYITPVLFAGEDLIEILLGTKNKTTCINLDDSVLFKFQKQGYEYLISGKVDKINKYKFTTITLKIEHGQKYDNMRRYRRFDTELDVIVKTMENTKQLSQVRNISIGGAMVLTSIACKIGSLISLSLKFPSGNTFSASAVIQRKTVISKDVFDYGVQFRGLDKENSKIINKEISKYEMAYFKNMYLLKDYHEEKRELLDNKITIFSYDIDESYTVRENLVRLGAENFEVFHNFKFYVDFFLQEKPEIVIIDSEPLLDDIIEILNGMKSSFSDIKMMLILDNKESENKKLDKFLSDNTKLFKPYQKKEFDKKFLKLLE